jgi:hypothetical protein
LLDDLLPLFSRQGVNDARQWRRTSDATNRVSCANSLVDEGSVVAVDVESPAKQRGGIWRYLRVGFDDLTQRAILRRLGHNTL